jgi:hypothetical protein
MESSSDSYATNLIEISDWVRETGAQGEPSRYCKTDLEIWTKRLFERHKFNAGKSTKERRRAFEEIWEVADGNPEAIAYGFDAALKARIYSIAYIKSCCKNFRVSPTLDKPRPSNPISIPKSPPPPAPPKVTRKPRAKKTEEPVPDVQWS